MFHYGAQYYRYPNPLPECWEDDFKKMRECGFTIVKLWVSWSIVNYKEGVYDFGDLNRLAEIAGRNGIQVVFNIIIENAPYWLTVKHPEAMYTSALGYKAKPHARGNTPAGGWPGLCLHNEPVREAAERFFTETANNFKGLPNLYAYDIWNEIIFEPNVFFSPDMNTGLYCYCDATQSKFKDWLAAKYRTLDALNDAWYRKYSDWNEVYPPIQRGGYPDMLDWLAFRLEDRTSQMQWRYDVFRRADPDVLLISHFACMDKQKHMADIAGVARVVDEWGVSTFGGYDRFGNTQEDFLYNLDVARVDARGKRFWQSELKGGQNTQGNGHWALKRSPMAREWTMRAWNWCILMAGAKGLMYWQYRPEYLGPETPGNGLTDLAGRETERLRQAAWFADFTKKHEFIEHTVPIKGEIGVLRLYESDLFSYLLDDKTNWYEKAVKGAYKGFSSLNFVVDTMYIDDLSDYRMVYIPFAQMITKENIEKIRTYVESGGIIITEACTAHYLDGGYCAYHVPGGLTDLFGCEQWIAETLFDRQETPVITLQKGVSFPSWIYQEQLTPLTGSVIGTYDDGSVAVVENTFGSGKTLLIGTNPSIFFEDAPSDGNQQLFAYLADWAGLKQNVKINGRGVKGRIHLNGEQHCLYIVNMRNSEQESVFEINRGLGNYTRAVSVTSGKQYEILENTFTVKLDRCEGDIYLLQ